MVQSHWFNGEGWKCNLAASLVKWFIPASPNSEPRKTRSALWRRSKGPVKPFGLDITHPITISPSRWPALLSAFRVQGRRKAESHATVTRLSLSLDARERGITSTRNLFSCVTGRATVCLRSKARLKGYFNRSISTTETIQNYCTIVRERNRKIEVEIEDEYGANES